MHFLDPPWNFNQQWLLLEIWSSQPPAMQEWEEIPQHTGIRADQERLIVWKTLSWCNHRLEAQASQKSYRPPGLWVSPAGWSLSLPLRIWENPAWGPMNSHWVSVLPTCKTLSTISKLSTVLWKEKKSQDAEEPHEVQRPCRSSSPQNEEKTLGWLHPNPKTPAWCLGQCQSKELLLQRRRK